MAWGSWAAGTGINRASITSYTLRELMEYMGHSSLQATERYVKLLPPPAGPEGAADRLNAYLAARATT